MAKPQSDVKTKSENKQAIFRYILNHKGATKQKLFTSLGLSLPTIKQGLETLAADGLLTEGEKIDNTGGRSAFSYQVAANSRYAIGLFLSLHHLTCVSINLLGEILYARRVTRVLKLQDPSYMEQLCALIEEVRQQTALPDTQLLGVGITLPTLVDEAGESTVFGMTSDFTGVTRRFFAQYIPYPVWLYHDSETAGFAEVWRAGDETSMVYLNLNSSIGSAVYAKGRLYNGDNQRAGELGHIVVDPRSTKRCYCGRTGCLDTICNTSVLDGYTGGSLQQFFVLLAEGDIGAQKLWDTYTDYLAVAIHNLRMMFDCSIIIGGYIGTYVGPFIEDIYQKVDSRSIFTPFSRTYIFPCKFKVEATAAGAALRVLDQFINTL